MMMTLLFLSLKMLMVLLKSGSVTEAGTKTITVALSSVSNVTSRFITDAGTGDATLTLIIHQFHLSQNWQL